jgi:hypothetical protein
MAISYSSLAVSVPNWQLLQTSTPSGVTSVTFSGLSGYSKYRILGKGLAATNVNCFVQMNGDTGSNYSYYGQIGAQSAPNYAAVTTSSALAAMPSTGSTCSFSIDIDHALLLSPKFVTAQGSAAGNYAYAYQGNGIYQTTSALSSITILTTAGSNYTAGSIYLLGAN